MRLKTSIVPTEAFEAHRPQVSKFSDVSFENHQFYPCITCKLVGDRTALLRWEKLLLALTAIEYVHINSDGEFEAF